MLGSHNRIFHALDPDGVPRALTKLQDFLEFRIRKLYRDPIFLHQKYVVEGLSITQVAMQIFSSKEAVRKGLLRAGISIREPHDAHGNLSQTRYGERVIKGRTVRLKVEEQIISVIKDLRVRGFSLREIGRTLTKMRVPTKCRGKAWHPQMIARILNVPRPGPVTTVAFNEC